MTERDDGYSVEELDDSHVRVTIDGEPVDVYIERRYSTHHHFGQFTSLDHLVDVIRKHRSDQADAAAEIERAASEGGSQDKGTA